MGPPLLSGAMFTRRLRLRGVEEQTSPRTSTPMPPRKDVRSDTAPKQPESIGSRLIKMFNNKVTKNYKDPKDTRKAGDPQNAGTTRARRREVQLPALDGTDDLIESFKDMSVVNLHTPKKATDISFGRDLNRALDEIQESIAKNHAKLRSTLISSSPTTPSSSISSSFSRYDGTKDRESSASRAKFSNERASMPPPPRPPRPPTPIPKDINGMNTGVYGSPMLKAYNGPALRSSSPLKETIKQSEEHTVNMDDLSATLEKTNIKSKANDNKTVIEQSSGGLPSKGSGSGIQGARDSHERRDAPADNQATQRATDGKTGLTPNLTSLHTFTTTGHSISNQLFRGAIKKRTGKEKVPKKRVQFIDPPKPQPDPVTAEFIIPDDSDPDALTKDIHNVLEQAARALRAHSTSASRRPQRETKFSSEAKNKSTTNTSSLRTRDGSYRIPTPPPLGIPIRREEESYSEDEDGDIEVGYERKSSSVSESVKPRIGFTPEDSQKPIVGLSQSEVLNCDIEEETARSKPDNDFDLFLLKRREEERKRKEEERLKEEQARYREEQRLKEEQNQRHEYHDTELTDAPEEPISNTIPAVQFHSLQPARIQLLQSTLTSWEKHEYQDTEVTDAPEKPVSNTAPAVQLYSSQLAQLQPLQSTLGFWGKQAADPHGPQRHDHQETELTDAPGGPISNTTPAVQFHSPQPAQLQPLQSTLGSWEQQASNSYGPFSTVNSAPDNVDTDILDGPEYTPDPNQTGASATSTSTSFSGPQPGSNVQQQQQTPATPPVTPDRTLSDKIWNAFNAVDNKPQQLGDVQYGLLTPAQSTTGSPTSVQHSGETQVFAQPFSGEVSTSQEATEQGHLFPKQLLWPEASPAAPTVDTEAQTVKATEEQVSTTTSPAQYTSSSSEIGTKQEATYFSELQESSQQQSQEPVSPSESSTTAPPHGTGQPLDWIPFITGVDSSASSKEPETPSQSIQSQSVPAETALTQDTESTITTTTTNSSSIVEVQNMNQPPKPAFGAPTGGFGTAPSGFGAPAAGFGAVPSGFGVPTAGFGAPAQSTAGQTSAFNSFQTQPSSGFGAPSVFGTSPTPAFATSSSPQPAFGGPAVGKSPTPAFAATSSPKPAFGGPVTSSSAQSAFGGPSTAQSVFGGANVKSAFGAATPKPAFGGPVANAPTPQSVFGAPAANAPAVKSVFGAPPTSAPANWTSAPGFGKPASGSGFGGSAPSTPPSTADSPESFSEPSYPMNAFASAGSNAFPQAAFPAKKANNVFGKPAESAFSAQASAMSSPQSFPEPTQRSATPAPATFFQSDKGKKPLQKFALQNSRADSSDTEDAAESRKARFTLSNDISEDYAAAKARREKERLQAIAEGHISDKAQDIKDAKAIIGTCEDMCPLYESIERQFQNNVDPLERGPDGKMDLSKAVKSFHRPAAGMDQAIPSDLRTEPALRRTLNYLIRDLLEDNSIETLRKVHSFVRDRTRSIRQDYSIQHIWSIEMVKVHEEIARFHMVSLQLLEHGESGFDVSQEVEQLNKCLITLMQFYNYRPGVSEREAEFRAYNILLNLDEVGLAIEATGLSEKIQNTKQMQRALEFQRLFKDGHYARLCTIVKQFNYLETCAIVSKLPYIARQHLYLANQTYYPKSKKPLVANIAEALNMNVEKIVNLLEIYGIQIRQNDPECWQPKSQFDDGKPIERLGKDLSLIVKAGEYTLAEIIEGSSSKVEPRDAQTPDFSIQLRPDVQSKLAASLHSVDVRPAPPFDFKQDHYHLTSPRAGTVQRWEPPSNAYPKGRYPDGPWDEVLDDPFDGQYLSSGPIPRWQDCKLPASGEVMENTQPQMPQFTRPTQTPSFFKPAPVPAPPAFPAQPQSVLAPSQPVPAQSVFAPQSRPTAHSPFTPQSAFNPTAKPFVPSFSTTPKAPVPTAEQKAEKQPESVTEAKPEPVKAPEVEKPAPPVEVKPPTPVKEPTPPPREPTPEPEPEPWVLYEEEELPSDSELPEGFSADALKTAQVYFKRHQEGKLAKAQVLPATVNGMRSYQGSETLSDTVIYRMASEAVASAFEEWNIRKRHARVVKRVAKITLKKNGVVRPKSKMDRAFEYITRPKRDWRAILQGNAHFPTPSPEPESEPETDKEEPLQSTTPPQSPPKHLLADSRHSSPVSDSSRKRSREVDEDEEERKEKAPRYSFHTKNASPGKRIIKPANHTYNQVVITPEIAENRRKAGWRASSQMKPMSPFQAEQIAIKKMKLDPAKKVVKVPEIEKSATALFFESIVGTVDEEKKALGRSMNGASLRRSLR